MAFLANPNPQDDLTEQTGQVNPNQQPGAPVSIGGTGAGADSSNAPTPTANQPGQFNALKSYLGAAQTGTEIQTAAGNQTNPEGLVPGPVTKTTPKDIGIWNPAPTPLPQPTIQAPVASTPTPGQVTPWVDPYADYQQKQRDWVKANPGAIEDPTKVIDYYDPNSGRTIHGDQGLAQRQNEWGQRYNDAMKTWGSPILTPEQQNQQYYKWDIGRQGPVNTMESRQIPEGYQDWLKQLLSQDNQYSRAYKDAQAKGQAQQNDWFGNQVIAPAQEYPIGAPPDASITASPAPIYQRAVAAPPNFNSTDPNATKGTGFTNIQRYLNANQTGATNLGTQVAGSINDQTNQAQTAVGKVGNLASSNPSANIWNTQEDINAQQAITNANQKAALTANVGGQSQLIRNIAPGTSRGGVNLDQFLMQQGGGYGQVANAAQNAAGLQGDYAAKSNTWQNNATTAQALQALQKQAQEGKGTGPVTVKTPSTGQVPNTSDIGANTDTGATTGNPYLGLSPEQIAYLKELQAKNAAGGGTMGGYGGAGAIGAGGLLNRGVISKTATASTTGGHTGVTVEGEDTGGFVDQSDQRYDISPLGVVTPRETINPNAANVIGTIIGAITGIPGLGFLGSYLAKKQAADNQAAADAAQQERYNQVLGVGGAMDIGGDKAGEGDTQGQAYLKDHPIVYSPEKPITPDQTQAAINEGNNLSPAERQQQEQESNYAQQQATENANRIAYAQAVAESQAAQREAAAQQQAQAQADAAAQAQADAQNEAQTANETDSSYSSDSSSDSSGGSDKDGGYMTGPGGPRDDAIPINVSNGEFVMNAAVVKALGKDFFERLNNSVKGK